jgi:hypothetical protein
MSGQRAVRRDGIAAQLGQVAALKFVLELDPVLPRLFERKAEDTLEVSA